MKLGNCLSLILLLGLLSGCFAELKQKIKGEEKVDLESQLEGDTRGTSSIQDSDNDGIADSADNCKGISNSDQEDSDSDGVGDLCDNRDNGDDDDDGIENWTDNCSEISNANQSDVDSDSIGDACDDSDNDSIMDLIDNCREVANAEQNNIDGDDKGDVCDSDIDNDGVENDSDNCSLVANNDQADEDNDGIGDACDSLTDSDNDGVADSVDNCRLTANVDQEDIDNDNMGNVCDSDMDGDSRVNTSDNCSSIANFDQADRDEDSIGDVCDEDLDGDTHLNDVDNCPYLSNADQADFDGDGKGDLCSGVEVLSINDLPGYSTSALNYSDGSVITINNRLYFFAQKVSDRNKIELWSVGKSKGSLRKESDISDLDGWVKKSDSYYYRDTIPGDVRKIGDDLIIYDRGEKTYSYSVSKKEIGYLGTGTFIENGFVTIVGKDYYFAGSNGAKTKAYTSPESGWEVSGDQKKYVKYFPYAVSRKPSPKGYGSSYLILLASTESGSYPSGQTVSSEEALENIAIRKYELVKISESGVQNIPLKTYNAKKGDSFYHYYGDDEGENTFSFTVAGTNRFNYDDKFYEAIYASTNIDKTVRSFRYDRGHSVSWNIFSNSQRAYFYVKENGDCRSIRSMSMSSTAIDLIYRTCDSDKNLSMGDITWDRLYFHTRERLRISVYKHNVYEQVSSSNTSKQLLSWESVNMAQASISPYVNGATLIKTSSPNDLFVVRNNSSRSSYKILDVENENYLGPLDTTGEGYGGTFSSPGGVGGYLVGCNRATIESGTYKCDNRYRSINKGLYYYSF